MTDREQELRRILAEIREREGPPDEFDGRGCLVLFALAVCLWIIIGGIVAAIV